MREIRAEGRGHGARAAQPPHKTHHATPQDTLTVKSFEETVLKYPGMMYMVCDGHMGDEASNFVSLHLLRVLASKLPPNPPEFGNEKGECAETRDRPPLPVLP